MSFKAVGLVKSKTLCLDKYSSRSLGSVSNVIHVNRKENHGQGSERGCSINIARFRQGLYHVISSLFWHITKRGLVVN